jgi:hypothetical protein
MEFCYKFDSVYNKIKVQISSMDSMFRLLCEFVIISKYDEMNCKFVFGVFYNVLRGADSGCMK